MDTGTETEPESSLECTCMLNAHQPLDHDSVVVIEELGVVSITTRLLLVELGVIPITTGAHGLDAIDRRS